MTKVTKKYKRKYKKILKYKNKNTDLYFIIEFRRRYGHNIYTETYFNELKSLLFDGDLHKMVEFLKLLHISNNLLFYRDCSLHYLLDTEKKNINLFTIDDHIEINDTTNIGTLLHLIYNNIFLIVRYFIISDSDSRYKYKQQLFDKLFNKIRNIHQVEIHEKVIIDSIEKIKNMDKIDKLLNIQHCNKIIDYYIAHQLDPNKKQLNDNMLPSYYNDLIKCAENILMIIGIYNDMCLMNNNNVYTSNGINMLLDAQIAASFHCRKHGIININSIKENKNIDEWRIEVLKFFLK